MSLRYLAIPAALLVASPAVLAAQGDEPNASTKEQAADESDEGMNKMECRREKVIGSRLALRKRCQTKAQWQAERAANRQAVERVQASRIKNE